MAVINTPKSFDKAQIDSEILGKIETFVDYVNQQFDQLTRALQNQLSFPENFKCKVLSIQAYNNKELSLNETAQQIVPLACMGDSIRQYSATVSNTGTQKITFKFGNAIPVRTRSVTYSSPFSTYECENVAHIQVGDRVSITAQTNQSNNGTFLVSEVGTSSIKVFNSSGVAATLTEYVGAYESAKSVTVLFLS